MDKQRLRITMKVLGEAKAFSENCRIYRRTPRARVFKRKYISGRGDFSFCKPRNNELAQKNFFYFVVLGFKAERFLLELHSTKYVM